MSTLPGDEEALLVLPVDASLERRLILAMGLYPADRLFTPVPVAPVRSCEED